MNDNENEWMTVTEVSEKINVPVETVRRYLRQFSLYLKVKKMHKKYLIHDDSLTVLETIRQQYAEGKNAEEIENFLATSGVTMTITVKDNNNEEEKSMFTTNTASVNSFSRLYVLPQTRPICFTSTSILSNSIFLGTI